MRISDFDALSFDCYGTLIDWETGIGERLQAWCGRHGAAPARETLLELFARAEADIERENAGRPYPDILRAVHRALAAALSLPLDDGEADGFATSVGEWLPFPDTPGALRALARRHRLIVISNVDRASFARTQSRLGVQFDAVVTAEDVGAYKPDHRMFVRAFETLSAMGIARERLLHVAQSLYHDHVPAKALGLRTVWVNRRRGRPGAGATIPAGVSVTPDLEVGSLAELVAIEEAEGPDLTLN